uniref:Uncharacterized protein n=1 Tax=Arundo donax TaxID=35708 RepID=A0A0A9HDQ8_ARUDO
MVYNLSSVITVDSSLFFKLFSIDRFFQHCFFLVCD